MPGLKVAAKIVVGFFFSIVIMISFLTTALFGVKASDTARLVVTEATGLRRDVVVFHTVLQPLVIHNIFYVCLALIGVMLIFLYFIDHSFRAFMGPGVLSIVITIFLVVMLAYFHEHINNNATTVAQLYIQSAVDCFRITAVGVIALGLALIAVSLWGDRLFKKARQ